MAVSSHTDPPPRRSQAPAAVAALLLVSLVICAAAFGQEVTTVFVVPSEPVAAGGTASVWQVVLNGSDRPASRVFQMRLDGRLQAEGVDLPVVLTLRDPAMSGEIVIPPGGYARREYVLTVPEGLEGPLRFSAPGIRANAVVLEVRRAEAVARTGEPASPGQPEEPSKEAKGSGPEDFFKAHIFGYEPAYFIMGTESPNAKFQISFKYRMLNSEGPLARRYPALQGFYFGYTQTSLWDWSQPSAPFLDSSYRPELLYSTERVDGGHWADWFRLDLQAGVRHESNGKGGTDSRSLNQAYFQPSMVFGKEDGFQFTLAPRAWAYLGSLGDNPDIADYRGHASLRAVLGWTDGLELSALGQLGDDTKRGSLELDLSYPMMRLAWGNASVYLYAQYFTGYGESLLLYNQRSSAFRMGFALYR